MSNSIKLRKRNLEEEEAASEKSDCDNEALKKLSHVKLPDKVAMGRKLSFAIDKGADVKDKSGLQRKLPDKLRQKNIIQFSTQSEDKFMPPSSFKKKEKATSGRRLSFSPQTLDKIVPTTSRKMSSVI